MTPKQILDSFSETLMQDERILSAQERALLTTLLQHARTVTGGNRETHEAVKSVIASAVGETVAQRAFGVLGGSVVERILADSSIAQNDAEEISGKKSLSSPGTPMRTPGIPGSPGQPQPPQTVLPPASPTSPGQPQPPQAPMPHKAPHRKHPAPPHKRHKPMRDTPVPPPRQPQPPQGSIEHDPDAEKTVAVLERPARLPAQCLVLDEFLAPQEVEELTRFALEREAAFTASEVVSPVSLGGVVDYEHRRSRVLMDLGPYEGLVLKRIKAVLPDVVEKLGMEQFSIESVETQITASNDGDFFRFHSDNGSDRVVSRYLTFVYFFHREPRQFEGGELRIHDARREGDDYVSEGSYETIVPQQNQIVFFPCQLLHEITPVKCPSGLFADSRFTLNGWLHR